ncbi:MAG: hypothetical protein KF819_15635 [Labilithrix sp.]|nr:hypothetical protein [Labilithrix sp.]
MAATGPTSRNAGERASSRPPPSGARPRRHPDDEALEIMMRFADRVAVARSLARMVSGAFRASATHASMQAVRVARAAKDAALHVAQKTARTGAEAEERREDTRDETR